MEIIRTRSYERKALSCLARAARRSSWKSGGVRILYYFWLSDKAVYLLDIYAKNQKENISDADKKLLKEMIKAMKGEEHA
ncbi:MAG: type II toxin-antitoxin system RelE/ParE family toxin [Alphaproteobacteria bacterium]|nr:type II toxin-antitoxin system RelE/ParE family toxin [Alphaproteobacteria bacterium]